MASNNSNLGWQRLYRALLRSSTASVRFSRPAARNTRRYLRDEFASALLAKRPVIPRPSFDRQRDTSNEYETLDVTSGGDSEGPPAKRNLGRKPKPMPFRNDADTCQLLSNVTGNTIAFHLSASLLPGASSIRKCEPLVSDQIPTRHAVSSHTPLHLDDKHFRHAVPSHVDPRTKLGASVATNHALTHAQSQGADLDLHDASNSAHDALAHHGPVPIKASRLAHRTIANLSSLTYHHLSPYTQMQSRAHLKDNRALRKPKTLSSLARVLGKIDSSSSDSSLEAALLEGEDTVVNEAHMKIGFLYPSIKPKRGPVSGRLKEWNGQDAEKVVSEGVLAQMQMDLDTVERLLEEHNSATVGQGKGSKKDQSASKQVQKLKTEAEQLKKRIKTVTKALMQAIAQSDLESIPVGHLADLVAAAQDKERLLLGKNRWLRRKNGEFLPP